MQPGDVVLLDSYQVLHGRETFEGPRQHAVSWLTDDFHSTDSISKRQGIGVLGKTLNRLAVKSDSL